MDEKKVDRRGTVTHCHYCKEEVPRKGVRVIRRKTKDHIELKGKTICPSCLPILRCSK